MRPFSGVVELQFHVYISTLILFSRMIIKLRLITVLWLLTALLRHFRLICISLTPQNIIMLLSATLAGFTGNKHSKTIGVPTHPKVRGE